MRVMEGGNGKIELVCQLVDDQQNVRAASELTYADHTIKIHSFVTMIVHLT